MALHRLRSANAHSAETFDGPFRDETGPINEAMAELPAFLRDHHSGKTIAMDLGVLDFLASVMDAVGATKATVLSAYRTRQTNAMLARTTFRVADNSRHIDGRTLDIRLNSGNEGAMRAARAMARGASVLQASLRRREAMTIMGAYSSLNTRVKFLDAAFFGWRGPRRTLRYRTNPFASVTA